jgi:hypothetical protein
MRIQKSIPLAVLTALLGLSIACTKSPKPSDDVITQDVQTKVDADPDTKDSQVTVAAKEGKVTLTGKVKTPAARKKVEQIAQEEPGVAAVDDQTAVQPEAEQAAQPAAPPAAPPPPPPQPIVVPTGTTLTVRVGQALGSKTSQTGQTFLATLAQPVSVGGRAAIPAQSTVSGTVLNAKAKGKIKGEAELSIALTSITVRGHTYQIQTEPLDSTSKGKGKRTAATTGGGAAGGALIGGIAGGGKGAAIGALVGGGAGLIGGAATGNKQIEIPAESALSFQLSGPLTLPPPRQ